MQSIRRCVPRDWVGVCEPGEVASLGRRDEGSDGVLRAAPGRLHVDHRFQSYTGGTFSDPSATGTDRVNHAAVLGNVGYEASWVQAQQDEVPLHPEIFGILTNANVPSWRRRRVL